MINLTGKPLNAQLESALGLGPGFRPTPKPTTDREVGKSLRQFASRIRNKAFFATNNNEEDPDYNPQLYLPTGNTVDPELPALDAELYRYEQDVQKALDSTPVEYGSPNCIAGERISLVELELNNRLREGTSDIAICKADKDSALCVVTTEQFISMWRSHYPADRYPLIDPSTFN